MIAAWIEMALQPLDGEQQAALFDILMLALDQPELGAGLAVTALALILVMWSENASRTQRRRRMEAELAALCHRR